jgi:hypothetical protein
MSDLAKHIEGLRKVLEGLLFPLSPSLIEKEIFAKDWEMVKFVPQQRGIKMLVTSSNKKESALDLPAGINAPRFAVLKTDSGFWIGNGYLYAGPGFAFFQGKVGEELEETLRMVRVLRPLFRVLDFPDLEGALEALGGFKEEEARFYGPYVLAWSGNPEEPAFLRKGTIFGDRLLDGAFLTGREVVLRYPRVKVTLEGKVNEKHFKTLFRMTKLTFEWEGAEASFVAGLFQDHLLCDLTSEERPGACLIRKGAKEILRKQLLCEKEALSYKLDWTCHLPPKMKAFLETLVETQDPLRALGDEDFFRQVSLRLLSFF